MKASKYKPSEQEVVEFRCDYPTKRIGRGNPYHCCARCGVSSPQINGRLEGHLPSCSWRIEQESK